MFRCVHGLFCLVGLWFAHDAAAFVFPVAPSAARVTSTVRPALSLEGLRMASGVAVPEVTVPKPTISFAPKSESETTTRPEDKFKVLLFNDNGNTREYVSRSLVLVVGLPEEEAFRIMQHANDHGMAQVGIWHQEMADAYCTSLKERGLIADTCPVDSDS